MLKVLTISAAIGLFAFAISVAGFSAWYSWQRHDQQANQEGGAEHTTEKGSQSTPSISPLVPEENPEQAIARYNLWLMLFTGVLALVAIIQIGFLISADQTASEAAKAANESAKAAQKAAEVSERTLKASQRAWIRAEVGIENSPLTFDRNGASTTVSFKISNIGNVPAIRITPHAWLVALKEKGGLFPWQEQLKRCGEVRQQSFGTGLNVSGFTLFPDERFPESIGVGGWSLGVNLSREEVDQALIPTPEGKHILALYIVGCIDYTFPSDSETHHQTGFLFELQKNAPSFIIFEDGTIPAGQLRLSEQGMGLGRYAD